MPVQSDRFKEFNAAVMTALANAAEILGIAVTEHGKEILSVPVESLGAGIVKRSDPGEPPRKETGELQADVQHDVDRPDPSTVKLEMSTGRFSTPEVPGILEFGGQGIAARPYFWADYGTKESMRTFTERIGLSVVQRELEKVK